MRKLKNDTIFRIIVRVAALLACAATIPRCISGYPARALLDDDETAQVALATEVKSFVDSGVAASAFHTGHARFDGEWAFGTITMATLGLGHGALHHPGKTADYVPTLDRCL